MNDIKRLARAIEELAAAIRAERATPQWIPYREPYWQTPYTITYTTTSSADSVGGGAHQQ